MGIEIREAEIVDLVENPTARLEGAFEKLLETLDGSDGAAIVEAAVRVVEALVSDGMAALKEFLSNGLEILTDSGLLDEGAELLGRFEQAIGGGIERVLELPPEELARLAVLVTVAIVDADSPADLLLGALEPSSPLANVVRMLEDLA